MSERYVISVQDNIISFRPDEIEDIYSLEPTKVWDVFTNACKRFYIEKNKFFLDNLKYSNNTLKKQGIELIRNSISPQSVEILKKEWEENFIPTKIKRSSQEIDFFTDGNPQEEEYSVVNYKIVEKSVGIVSKIVMEALNTAITNKIEHYLESYFAVDHILFAEAFPDRNPITSFRWHMDGGPASQTHIMIYLDDAEITGGRTEFINYEDTKKIHDSGYRPFPAEDRVLNIKDIDPTVEIIKPSPRAGDMIIFNATQIYHCGVHPEKSSRKVLFIILHSDFLPWIQTISQKNVFGFSSGHYLYRHNPFKNYHKEI